MKSIPQQIYIPWDGPALISRAASSHQKRQAAAGKAGLQYLASIPLGWICKVKYRITVYIHQDNKLLAPVVCFAKVV